MALYFDKALHTPAECITIYSAWQKVSNIFAVCSGSPSGGAGHVNIYNSDGEKKNKSESLIHRTYLPTRCAWHPGRNLLAIAWENGEIQIWNDHNEELHDVPQMHDQPITVLEWSGNGSRLASGDKTGIIALWRVNDKGRVQLNPICRHELGSEVTQCIAPIGNNDAVMSKIASLAKAAVRGDEKALDQFLSYNQADGTSKSGVTDGVSFFFGSANGDVIFVNSKGENISCIKMNSAIKKLLFYSEREALVSISFDLEIVVSQIHGDGKAEELTAVKLSGQGTQSDITWAGEGLLAAATSDRSLRLWDLRSNDNYTLSLGVEQGYMDDERIVCVAYSEQKRILSAGTDKSHVAMWNFSPSAKSRRDPEQQWHLQQATKLDVNPSKLSWAHRKQILAVISDRSVLYLNEQKMNWALTKNLVAVQTSPKSAVVELLIEQAAQSLNVSALSRSHAINFMTSAQSQKTILMELHADSLFTGLAVANQTVAVWNTTQATIYDIVSNKLVHSGSFPILSSVCALHDQSFFTAEIGRSKDISKIEVRNFKGTVKQVVQFQDKEGEVSHMNVCGDYLLAATKAGFIKIFNLTKREAKAVGNAIDIRDVIPYFASFQDIKCNSTGTKVAMIIRQENGEASSKLYVYDVEKDKMDDIDFATGQSSDDLHTHSEAMKESIAQHAADVAGRYPVSVHWDTEEPAMLVCEAQLTDVARKNAVKASVSNTSVDEIETPDIPVEELVVLLYSTRDTGILVQDSVERNTDQAHLIGLRAPSFYFTKMVMNKQEDNRSEENGEVSTAKPYSKLLMRDFVGLEDCDPTTRRAMMDFSFKLAMGNIDEAFKAIQLIKSEAVWESMAKMCVKTKRVDVAKVCLGRMGHVRGAHALREAEKEPELDAKVAMLAIQLGMNDEAERLYKKCQRYDLLNQFYQATGRWAKALEVAEQLDRIHLRNTFHNYGKYLESNEDFQGATSCYEKAGTDSFEIPRMLFEDVEMLESYIENSTNKVFLRWWAQYMESTGEMEEALKYYQQANDILSLVRVYCYCGNVEKAVAIANETRNRAACYHLARHFENNDDVKQAIHFYTSAATYGNAIRICKEHGFEDQLINLSLLGSKNDMIDAATYYETRPDLVDKAVLLYHKAGHFSKALKLAFDTQQFAALESIAQDLDERADPVLLERCAKFFIDHGQYDKAVSLLVIAKQYTEAVDLCLQNNVELNETLVERLTPQKDETPSSGTREQLLMKLGDCCMKQGAYHLACKKYTQAGDRERAMRALLKSGDTEKIIFFAGVSRSRNIYVMAANYLQSLDWRADPEIMKHIINYYTKGRALDSLAGFYDACAQVEIDEYQNYDKALGALTEAFKCLSKAKMPNKQQQEDKITELKTRIALVKKFIQAKRLLDSDPAEAIKQCHVLLAEPDLDSAVRIGDVYGMLIEHHAQNQVYDKASQLMKEMQDRIPTVNMAYYVNVQTIETVQQALGISTRQGDTGNKRVALDSDEDEIDKGDISEEIYENGDSTIDMYRFR